MILECQCCSPMDFLNISRFQLVILKMRPWYYFNFFLNSLQLCLCILLLYVPICLFIPRFISLNRALYFNLATWLNGTIYAMILVIQFFMTNYDNNVINAISPHEIMGLSFALQGYVCSFFLG